MKTNQKVHPSAIEFLTQASWEFTRKHLYGGLNFSTAETAIAKQHIRNYYRDIIPELFHKYAGLYIGEFFERVLLARNYVSRRPFRFVPNPSWWLNPDNEKGFAGTKRWHKQNLERNNGFRLFKLNGEIVCVCDLDYFFSKVA